MKRFCLVLAVIGVLAGCQNNMSQIKEEANKRWCHSRAQMLYAAGAEYLKVGQLTEARAKTQEALVLDAESLPAHLLLGKIYIEEGRYDLAITELELVVDGSPKPAEALYLLGVAQEKAGKLEEALYAYRRSYAMDGNNIHAVTAAVEVLAALERLDEACEMVDTYAANSGSDPSLYELGGRLAMMKQDFAKAVECYQKASDAAYENTLYRQELARAQFFAGSYAEAAETFASLQDGGQCELSLPMQMMMAECLISIGQQRQARNMYAQITEKFPQSTEGWIGLAKSSLACNDNQRAILSSRQALTIDETSGEASMLLGYAMLREGSPQVALDVLKRSAAWQKDSAEFQVLLGRAYAANGQAGEAEQCYRAALSLDNDNQAARLLLERAGQMLSRVDADSGI